MKNRVDSFFVKDPRKLKLYNMCMELNKLMYKDVRQFPRIEENNMKIQIIKSVTSIGANLTEGNGQIYPAKELTFLNNSLGSAQESRYWYDLARVNSYVTEAQFETADNLLQEVILILIAMMKRLKNHSVA